MAKTLWSKRVPDLELPTDEVAKLESQLNGLSSSMRSLYSSGCEPKNLIAVHDEKLFVWHPEESAVHCYRLKGANQLGSMQVN